MGIQVDLRRAFHIGLLSLLWLAMCNISAAPGRTQDTADKGAVKQPGSKAVIKDGEHKNMQKAIFGAGCFWGVEEVFRQTPGVVSTTVGYCGGTMKNPTYQDVCTGKTGHAEVVEVEYDPAKVSYEKLLNVFFSNHDPTSVNRQGPDFGHQYRSVVFYLTPEQKAQAQAVKEKLDASKRFRIPIATAIEPAQEFYRAEDYHQQYLEKHGLKVCH